MRLRLLITAALIVLWLALPASTPPPAPPIAAPAVTRPVPVSGLPSLRFVIEDQARWYEFVSNLPAPTPVTFARRSARTGAVVYGTGACGGDLPPCSVMMCESGGNLRAKNPHSTASGKWQILDTSWGGYGGYAHASDAPEDVQDARAREIYAGGAGRRAWVCK